jgi:hypothetical protein
VAVAGEVTATFDEAIDAATVSTGSVRLRAAGASSDVAASVSYSSSTRTVTLSPAEALEFSTGYTVTLQGGVGGIADTAGNPLAGDVTWSFTSAAAPPSGGPGLSVWDDSVVPPLAVDTSAVELGV